MGFVGDSHRRPRPLIWLGLASSVLIAAGACGAGATLLHDPLLSGTPLDGWRRGTGKAVATVLLYVGVALLVPVWVRLGHAIRAKRATTQHVVRAIWAWATPLLIAPPLFSTDLYTYLAQGAVAHAGLDPYTHVPAELPSPITAEALGGWLSIPSPYGPLFMLLMKGVLALTGGSPLLGALLTKLAIGTGLALLCLALPPLCRRLGTEPASALWLGVANPLVLLYLVSGAHNDLLMLGLLVSGTVLVLDHAPVRGFALVALAAAVKVTAAVALPFLLWIWVAQRADGRRPTWSVLAGVTAAAVSTVVAVFGVCTLLLGGGLGWITALSGNLRLTPWLSLSTAAGRLTGDIVATVATVDPARLIADFRLVGYVVLAAFVGWLWWRSRAGGAIAVRGATWALLATVLLSPVVFPWYFTWPLALGATATWPRYRAAAVAGVSTWLVLSTHPDGRTLLPPWGFAAALGFSVAVAVLAARPAWPRRPAAVPAPAGHDRPAPQAGE